MRYSLITIAAAFLWVCPPTLIAQGKRDNIGHDRHKHKWGKPHPSAPDASRFHTNREGLELPLPGEQDAFTFVVFGDRTGGPASGVSILADAVRDTNLLEPDMVMTVGDLVSGYNEKEQWMAQMREYKSIMNELLCPWFPVAGNHDIYWRGSNKPKGQHESNYEVHFGPLWYAFEHKKSWFVCLYTDEGNPITGEKSIDRPDCQVMSPAQLEWLGGILKKAKEADHVFVFVHHPRWIGGKYGRDWNRVHRVLKDAGNVTAVFAGHEHSMRSDPKDGIEYVTLATIGGNLTQAVPQAGWLHQFHIVTVRKDQVALSAVPVGEVMDVRELSADVVAEAFLLNKLQPKVDSDLVLRQATDTTGIIRAKFQNRSKRPLDISLYLDSEDTRWRFAPDHVHRVLEPGQTLQIEAQAHRPGDSLDSGFRPARVRMNMDYLMPGFRYQIPSKSVPVPMKLDFLPPSNDAANQALDLRGTNSHIAYPDSQLLLPDGPFTVETWFLAQHLPERSGLVAKTESSEFGLLLNFAEPNFYLHVDGKYVRTYIKDAPVVAGRWHHVACVFDGAEVRMYLDGVLSATKPAKGVRTQNRFPLMIGADVSHQSNAVSHFSGALDGVRISKGARYAGVSFQPQKRPKADENTILLFNMDSVIGSWLYDEAKSAHHQAPVGRFELMPVEPR